MTFLSFSTRAILLAAVFSVSTAGCASLRAPVELSSIEQTEAFEHALHIEAVEGRPSGLLLRFECACRIPEDGFVEVLKREENQPPQTIRSVRLGDRLRTELVGNGVELLDRSVQPNTETVYQVRLRAAEQNAPAATITASNLLVVRWEEPPNRTEQIRASSEVPGVVELRWTAPRTFGALVFRRDVLEQDGTTERLAQVGPGAHGVFVDHDVTPGGVYAYRIALSLNTGAMLQYGRPSQEIYVTVRAAPRGARQSSGRR